MKKIIIIIICCFISLIIFQSKEEKTLIPSESIRVRIIASSDSKEDQQIKETLQTDISKSLVDLISPSANIDEARKNIIKNLDTIDSLVAESLDKQNVNQSYKVNYGINYFPVKTFKGVSYQAGNYESLLITLGNATGKNWWCVLFPPLCLLETEEEKLNEVEYQFFIKKVIDKYS